MKYRHSGFTLIELMIVIVIISILAGIAYPSYTAYVERGRRSDGQSALLDLSHRMDQYFSEHKSYKGATLAQLGITETSPEGYYNLSINDISGNSYTANAVPLGAQSSDKCGTLTLNQLGQRSFTGTSATLSECW
ncbi:MAG: pilE [Gammaproteobacteria bacterium]|jgi:type IV pilus assembly protein PilE|nr:pilE [Gammaproteobacteria bacterium]